MAKKESSTKNKILRAARILFSTHGYDGTSIDDILIATGITKGAFYHYFKSKETLCQTILDEVVADYKNIDNSMDKTYRPIEQLSAAINKILELNNSGQWVNCRLIMRMSTDSMESHPEIQRKVNDFWRWYQKTYGDLIQQCREADEISTQQDEKFQLQMIISMLAGTILTGQIKNYSITVQLTTEAIIKMLHD